MWIPLDAVHLWEHQSIRWANVRPLLTNRFLRIRWRRPSRNCDGWFGPDGSQNAIFVPWFALPRSTISVAKVISTLIGVITYSPQTVGEPVFILKNVV